MILEIPIELIVLGVIIFELVFISFIFMISKIFAKRRYKPENDRSRQGEEKRRGNEEDAREALSVPRPRDFEERRLLPPTDVTPIRENSSRPRNPFKRTRGK